MGVESPNEPSRDERIALISAQSARISALVAENAALKARIGELERRLGLNGSNSGKPPSSDGLKKPARAPSLRETSERKPGGQKGREGQTLRRSAEPDVVEDRFPAACGECGAALTPDASAGHAARGVRSARAEAADRHRAPGARLRLLRLRRRNSGDSHFKSRIASPAMSGHSALTLPLAPLRRPDPPIQRLVQRVPRVEHVFERHDADPLGAFPQKPAREIGRGALGAVERHETPRVGRLAEGGDGAEARAPRRRAHSPGRPGGRGPRAICAPLPPRRSGRE